LKVEDGFAKLPPDVLREEANRGFSSEMEERRLH